MALTFAIVGGLIASQRSRNPVGWLFLFMAIVMGVGGVAAQYARLAAITHPGLPGAQWALWWYIWSEQLVYPAGGATVTLLLIPDGRLPSRRWRPVIPVAIVVTLVVTVVIDALGASPLQGPEISRNSPIRWRPEYRGAHPGASWLVWVIALALLLIAATAPFVRLRRARGEEREQLKWIAYVVVCTALATIAVYVAQLIAPQSVVASADGWLFVNLLGFGIALPVAIGIAVLKYRLYDIDIIISRTIVYGALAVFITAVYVGIAVGIGALVGGGGKPNLALSILATAIVALGFQPVRERMQQVANRLVYGKRASPYEVLSEFSGRLAETYAADEVLPRMARVLKEGTGAEFATVWLRGGADLRPAATFPDGIAAHESLHTSNGALPFLPEATRTAGGAPPGRTPWRVERTKRRGENLTPIEEKLVDDLAHQAGLVLKNVGLSADLQARLDDLRASRQRLVQRPGPGAPASGTQFARRCAATPRRLKVKLGLAEMLLGRDPAKAMATLEQLKGDADEALETLRDLARGIYPPLLADKGLVVALESQARKATVPVTVCSRGRGALFAGR